MDSRTPMTVTCAEDRGAFDSLARTGEANTPAELNRTVLSGPLRANRTS